ncbi:hypothetical protein Tco_1428727 [Tanacetum coccineum]
MVLRAVLMKSGLVSVNTARQVNVARSKTIVNAARPMSYLSKISHSTVKRPIHKNTVFKNRNFNQRVNTVKDKNVNSVRPKAVVNAAKPKAVVNALKGNNVNVVSKHNSASTIPKWFNYIDAQGRSKSDKGVIDSGCSRHMAENMSYLTEYEEIDGGYVAYGGNPKGGKITRKEQTAKENMSIEEMRHEQQLVDYKIKEITNDLGIKRFRGEEIDEEYERDCEIRIHKLKQDFNKWGSEVRKKEQAYEEEKYSAARRRMLSIPFVDEDDYVPLGDIIARYSTSKAITLDLPIEEPNNSLNMGDEHLDTIPTTESDEVIKSRVENLVPIPSEFEGMSDDTCDVPTCDNNCVNVESDFVESLINGDTLIFYSSKIDPILKEFAGELAHIAPIPPGIIEANFDPNDDISSDDDDFEDIEYVSFEEVNDVEQEEKEFDLEDILQIQDVILREKLLKISPFITNIEYLKDNPNPIPVTDNDSSDTSLSFLNNSLPEFESFSDHTEETRSGSTTTHAN